MKIKNRIAVIYGRFQLLTKAHYDMIKTVLSKYSTVFVFVVQGINAYRATIAKTEKGKKSELERKLARNPLPAGLRISLIIKAFPKLKNDQILKATQGSVEQVYHIIKRMKPRVNVNKMDVYAGPDEFEEYTKQLRYMNFDEYKDVDIKIIKYDSGTREEISATKLREAISNNDYEVFKKLIAEPLSNILIFKKLKKLIDKEFDRQGI